MTSPLSRLSITVAAIALISACGADQEDAVTVPGAPVPPSLEQAEGEVSPVSEDATDDHGDDNHGHSHDDDHDHEHNHDDDHNHGHSHNHDDDHDHSHDDHAHDHDHDHAGGEAHVHGHGELAIVRDGETLTVELTAPLANFGLPGDTSQIADPDTFAATAITLVDAGGCVSTSNDVAVETNGQHGDVTINRAFACDDAGDPAGVGLGVFEAYSGFETVEAIYLVGTQQDVLELTPTQTEFALR